MNAMNECKGIAVLVENEKEQAQFADSLLNPDALGSFVVPYIAPLMRATDSRQTEGYAVCELFAPEEREILEKRFVVVKPA